MDKVRYGVDKVLIWRVSELHTEINWEFFPDSLLLILHTLLFTHFGGIQEADLLWALIF